MWLNIGGCDNPVWPILRKIWHINSSMCGCVAGKRKTRLFKPLDLPLKVRYCWAENVPMMSGLMIIHPPPLIPVILQLQQMMRLFQTCHLKLHGVKSGV